MSPRNRITRRTILKGLGAAMALPWLESTARAAGAETPPIRMAFWYTPNGVHLPTWFPERDGVLVDLPYTLQPLSFARDDLVVFHGLSHSRAETNGDDPGCGHGLGAASFLTGAQAFKSQDQIQVGVSVDQIYAQHVGRATRVPSLEIGFEPSRSGNAFGYSGTYKANISWRTATTPAPYEMNPKLVFDRLFSDGSSSGSEAAIAERDFYRKSVLDYVSDDARQLRKSISRGDQQKLDQYLTSVREVESRIQNAAPAVDISKSGLTRPAGIPDDFDAHARIMNDLVVLAFQTDTTRVATLMLAVEAMNRSYPHLGFSDGHHELSHHGDDLEKNRKLREIDRYHISLLADMVEKLKAIPEGDGTVLDHSMILYGSGLSDGDRHDHVNLPVILVGGGGGQLKTGRHFRCRQETPMCNVLLTMLQQAGVPLDRFGDSTEALPGLT